MSLTFAVEPLAACWNEAMALAAAHWQETEGYRHGQGFQPIFERYHQYDIAGWFFMATARDGTALVGYAGMYVTPSMHTQLLIATEDTFFLLPAYRKGRNGIRFVQFVEAECWKRGAVEIGMTAKMSNPAAGRILEYLKYQPTSMQYTKQIVMKEHDADVRTESAARA
jgi:GNAT superfamily N-acetyltransferase